MVAKALTVRQPWAAAIIHLGKNVENRSRHTNYRGRLYVQAAKSEDVAGPAAELWHLLAVTKRGADPEVELGARGLVLGAIDVVGSHNWQVCRAYHGNDLCSPWAFNYGYHWELANPLPIEIPFEAKGQLGIWNLGPSSVEELAS